jgi:hypothetical protein
MVEVDLIFTIPGWTMNTVVGFHHEGGFASQGGFASHGGGGDFRGHGRWWLIHSLYNKFAVDNFLTFNCLTIYEISWWLCTLLKHLMMSINDTKYQYFITIQFGLVWRMRCQGITIQSSLIRFWNSLNETGFNVYAIKEYVHEHLNEIRGYVRGDQSPV